jgi:hypothetical protein
MKTFPKLRRWILPLIGTTLLASACGVKGPPLPPIPASAELSETASNPQPTTTPGN